MSAPKQIVVVEDERHLAAGIQFNLEAEGYQVQTVGDGPAALRLIEEQEAEIDLVILDIMLPGMSGYAVCESIRAFGCDVPVLMLTARTLPEDRTRGFDSGASQYLSKPFDLDELLSRVRNLLTHFPRRRQAAHVMPSKLTRYEFGQAQIDFAQYDLTLAGQKVDLTKREWELLQYFVEHAGRLIPRPEIIQNVWHMPGHVQTRAPDQFILRLRKIFERDPAAPQHFLTVRDLGYRFVPNPAAEPPASDSAPGEASSSAEPAPETDDSSA